MTAYVLKLGRMLSRHREEMLTECNFTTTFNLIMITLRTYVTLNPIWIGKKQ